MKGIGRIIAVFMVVTLAVTGAACNTMVNKLTASSVLLTPAPMTATPSPAATITAPTPIQALETATPSPAATITAPTPIQALETATPEQTSAGNSGDEDDEEDGYENEVPDYDIPDIKNVGLSNEQYQKIELLLYGAFGIYGEEGGQVYFDDVDELNTRDYLNFVSRVMESFEILGFDNGEVLSVDEINKIVISGLGIDYQAKDGDASNDWLKIENGELELAGNGGDGRDCAYTYSIKRIAADRLEANYNVVFESAVGSNYVGKAQAVLQADKNSLFGYYLVSVTKGEESNPGFTSTKASSSLPASGSKTFVPGNAIDGKGNTAWVTAKGTNEWIMLIADTPQEITGLNLRFGDWTSDNTIEQSGQPSKIRLDFSDGTFIEEDVCEAAYTDTVPCITFGRAVSTTYVKITILEVSEYFPMENIYISEVSPF